MLQENEILQSEIQFKSNRPRPRSASNSNTIKDHKTQIQKNPIHNTNLTQLPRISIHKKNKTLRKIHDQITRLYLFIPDWGIDKLFLKSNQI